MQPLIIESRVNEYASRRHNPNVPWTPEEIARDARACRAAGAGIVHFHARQADGAPSHDPHLYADIVARIHDSSDILVHPTLGAFTVNGSAEQRVEHVMAMAREPRTRPDFFPMDMGSTNVDSYDAARRTFRTTESVYRNTTATLQHFAASSREAGLKPVLACWNVGFTRHALAFGDSGLLDHPLYIQFVLTEGTLLAGHPGTRAGLDAHLAFLPRDGGVEWSACLVGGDLLQLTEAIVALGGHVALGLGDHSYAEHGALTNAELVARVVEIGQRHGREPASPVQVREMLAMAR